MCERETRESERERKKEGAREGERERDRSTLSIVLNIITQLTIRSSYNMDIAFDPSDSLTTYSSHSHCDHLLLTPGAFTTTSHKTVGMIVWLAGWLCGVVVAAATAASMNINTSFLLHSLPSEVHAELIKNRSLYFHSIELVFGYGGFLDFSYS